MDGPAPVQGRALARNLGREELASALTHGLGAAAALAGGAILVALAARDGDGWQLAAAIVFGLCLLLLYIASTLYHAIGHPQTKARMKVLDHCAIYLLIAGTYTPFTLIGLRGEVGWILFGAIWTLAVAGIVFKLYYTGRFKLLRPDLHRDGWLVVLAIKPVMAALDGWTRGCSLAESPIRSEPCSTTARRCVIHMRSGTCSCLPAARATTLP